MAPFFSILNTIDLDKPAFGAFFDHFLGQFPERNHGMPLDIAFVAELGLSSHVEGGSTGISSEEGRICSPAHCSDKELHQQHS
jgi:hypothetical protein